MITHIYSCCCTFHLFLFSIVYIFRPLTENMAVFSSLYLSVVQLSDFINHIWYLYKLLYIVERWLESEKQSIEGPCSWQKEAGGEKWCHRRPEQQVQHYSALLYHASSCLMSGGKATINSDAYRVGEQSFRRGVLRFIQYDRVKKRNFFWLWSLLNNVQ